MTLRTTHDHIAVHAMSLTRTRDGINLASQLSRHRRVLIAGARAPDRRFRDFQNHGVHVTDRYWGGGPRVAHRWYGHLVTAVARRHWREAAWAAGVMGHYVADAMCPLHTAHCDRERNLHAPIEWAIEQIAADLIAGRPEPITLSGDIAFLGRAMLDGARRAHEHYWTFLGDFDVDRLPGDPASACGPRLRRAATEMLHRSSATIAATLDRAADEAAAIAGRGVRRAWPSPDLASTIGHPLDRWSAARSRRRGRRRIAAMVEQLRRDGELSTTLPTEIRVTHRVAEIRRRETNRLHDRHRQTIAGRIEPAVSVKRAA